MSAAATASRTEKPTRWIRRLGPYALLAMVTVVLATLLLRPWSASGQIFTSGADYLWMQASAQVAAEVGPFGIDPNLGWPTGYSLWSAPQLGIWIGALLWLFGGLLSASSAAAVLWAVAVSAGLNAAACMYFFRSITPTAHFGWLAAFSIALGASPAVLFVPAHANVGAWFLIPLVLGMLFRIDRVTTRGRQLAYAAVLFAVAVVAPLWWLVVALLLVAAMTIPSLIMRERRRILDRILLLAGLVGAFAFQYALTKRVPNIEGTVVRSPWDSNLFAGHLVDLLLASPLVDKVLPRTGMLLEGASEEFKPIGLIAGVTAIVLVLVVMVGAAVNRLFPRLRVRDRELLSQMSIVSVLFFLVGGFGNLQATAGIMVGVSSPARVWSRFGLILALIGCAWLLVALRRWSAPKLLVWALSAAVVGVWFVDSAATTTVDALPVGKGITTAEPESFAEYGAVEFITSNTQPCPVLQLPVMNGIEVQTRAEGREPATFYYRGYIPFLMRPDYAWTYGSVTDADFARVKADADTLPTVMAGGVASPYCAVLFDKAAAELRTPRGLPLAGNSPDALGTPSFTSERFDVYLLTR